MVKPCLANSGAVGADGVPSASLGYMTPTFLLVSIRFPLRDIGLEEPADAEAEMIGPFEGRGRAGLGAAAEIPGLPTA